MSRQNLKQQIYSQVARIGKDVCHGHRPELLKYLAPGQRTVQAPGKTPGLSVPKNPPCERFGNGRERRVEPSLSGIGHAAMIPKGAVVYSRRENDND